MPPTILIAEDETDVLDFLQRAIQRIVPNATLIPSSNGSQAFELFKQHRCDLIISDHRMPQMSGMELLVAVRQVSPVPFIMLSADTLIAPQAHAAGVTEFLEKPMSLQTLRATLDKHLP